MTYRFEFEEPLGPLQKGRCRVRAYVGDECVMSGVLEPQTVTVTPPRVDRWCPCHESARQVFERYPNDRIEDGMRAIDMLVTALRKWHVFVFIDNCPWVIEGVPGYGTEAEADAFVGGFHYYTGDDTRAIRWPFTAPELSKVLHEVDADALMVDVMARVASLGLVTT